MPLRRTRASERAEKEREKNTKIDTYFNPSQRPGMAASDPTPGTPGRDVKDTPAAAGSTNLQVVLTEIRGLGDKFVKLSENFEQLEKKFANWQSEIETSVKNVEGKTALCEEKLDSYKETFDEATAVIKADSEEKKQVQDRVEQLEQKVGQLTTESVQKLLDGISIKTKEMSEQQEYLNNVREREIRKKNIRLIGIVEEENERTIAVAKNTLKSLTKNKLENIYSAYRMGKKQEEEGDSKPRVILLKFRDVHVRNVIFKDCRKNKAKLPEIYVQDHLTPQDLIEKRKALPQMKEAQNQGKKHEFRDGKLRIEGKIVEIKEPTREEQAEAEVEDNK